MKSNAAEEFKLRIEEKIKSDLKEISEILQEMHRMRNKERPIKNFYRRISKIKALRTKVQSFLIEKMNDLVRRGSGVRDFRDIDTVLAENLDKLNIILLKAKHQIFEYKDSLSAILKIVEDKAPENEYEEKGNSIILPKVPPVEYLEDKLVEIRNEYVTSKLGDPLSDIEEIILEMVAIYKSPHNSIKDRNDALRDFEHQRIAQRVEKLSQPIIEKNWVELKKLIDKLNGKNLTDDLKMVEKELNRYMEYIKSRGAQLRDYYLDLNTLRRFHVRRQEIKVRWDQKRKDLRIRRRLALKFLIGGGEKPNCPKFRTKYAESSSIRCIIHLDNGIVRKFKQGAILKGLKFLPPNLVSGHVVANVALGRVPHDKDTPVDPWFDALTQQKWQDEKCPKDSVRAIDINQLNCWRPNAHGILQPGPERGVERVFNCKPWVNPVTADIPAHISALDFSILVGGYIFKKGAINSFEGLKSSTERAATGSSSTKLRKLITPPLNFFWKVRNILLEESSKTFNSKESPIGWDGSTNVFFDRIEKSQLKRPAIDTPFDIYKEDRPISFNDEANAIPYYWAGKRAHYAQHLDRLLWKLYHRVYSKLGIDIVKLNQMTES